MSPCQALMIVGVLCIVQISVIPGYPEGEEEQGVRLMEDDPHNSFVTPNFSIGVGQAGGTHTCG